MAGLLSLAAAMGVGRFAFTPMLPLMLREHLLDVAQGGWLASANYAGYLVGALTASRVPLRAGTLALVALLATAALTAGMALPLPPLWLVLRFLAGAASAWVFVATSVWCLGALAQRGDTRASGWVYAGVGGGIGVTGLLCLAASTAGVPSHALWLRLGAFALLLALPVAWVMARLTVPGAAAGQPRPARHSPPAENGNTRGIIVCYGVMGFGYILPATFLPVLARAVLDDPRVFGLTWPVFGATAALSTLAAARLLQASTRLQSWAVGQLVMGAGVLLPVLGKNGWSITLSALLVGGTFMIITLAGVQEMRARATNPADAASLVGRITAAFALGQIVGPAVSSLLLRASPQGLELALLTGAAALFVTGAWLWRSNAQSTLCKELPDG
jgi:predicted MFS family arabinose efflux permease